MGIDSEKGSETETGTVEGGGGGRGREREKGRANSRSRSRSESDKSDEGHIRSDITHITDRFEIMKQLDRGTFGAVFKAYDSKRRESVAIKVVRRVKRYVEDAYVEVGILQKLTEVDKNGNYCVLMYKNFTFGEHFCIVTELLGPSLYHALKDCRKTPEGGVRAVTLRNVSRQLLEAMKFLEEAKLIHADLKTENVLLQNAGMSLDDDDPKVKLIDFGAATWDKDDHSTIIQTRHYRAPEVVLGLSWTFPCDMWSAGCIVLELHEGSLTFDTHDTPQHLAMMERLSGTFPLDLARNARHGAQKMFDSEGKLLWPELSGGSPGRRRDPEAERQVFAVKSLKERLHRKHDTLLLEMLAKVMVLNPKYRHSGEQALEAPYFAEQ